MNSRFLGSVGLISGTAIGAAMLAMPVSTAAIGWFPSILSLVLMATLMIYSGLLVLEALARMPGQNTMISIAGETLGMPGRITAMFAYIFLLFSLNASYLGIAGEFISDFLASYTSFSTLYVQIAILVVFATLLLTRAEYVDHFNRVLIIGMILCYIGLNFYVLPHVKLSLLSRMGFHAFFSSLPIIATAFGYHPIIPHIFEYLGRDVQQTRRAIIFGTLSPLLIYALWQFAVLGTLSYEGAVGLKEAQARGMAATSFLVSVLDQPVLRTFGLGFSFFAIMTSFLGTFLGMIEFLLDAFKISDSKPQQVFVTIAASIPLLLVNLYVAKVFMAALGFAGLMTAVLIGLLPLLMTYRSRQIYKNNLGYVTSGGTVAMVISAIAFSIVILVETGLIR